MSGNSDLAVCYTTFPFPDLNNAAFLNFHACVIINFFFLISFCQ